MKMHIIDGYNDTLFFVIFILLPCDCAVKYSANHPFILNRAFASLANRVPVSPFSGGLFNGTNLSRSCRQVMRSLAAQSTAIQSKTQFEWLVGKSQ